ncbi:MAG TPA: hypothetical protein VMX74_13065 [Pirellulales bacterium]|nr:hypothetical protein [Pirellulales bacterium]
MNCKFRIANSIRSLVALTAVILLLNSSVTAQGPGGPGSHFASEQYGPHTAGGDYLPHGQGAYSTAPVSPAPPDHGLYQTRWRPWNRSTIYPVYPGMPEPPSSGPRKKQPGELPPLPDDDNGSGGTNGDGSSSTEPNGQDTNGDDSPEPPPDLDPGLPLPGGDSSSDEFSPISPYQNDDSPNVPQDLSPPANGDGDSAAPDPLPELPDELPLPIGEPADADTSQKDGWKSSGHVADAWRKAGLEKQPVAKVRSSTRTNAKRPATPRLVNLADAKPLNKPSSSWPANPLRSGPGIAHDPHVVPTANWQYDRR